MKNQSYDTISLRCQEINQRVKLAERHQQGFYREQVKSANKGPSVWSVAWKGILALAALIRTFTALPPIAYFGRPAPHPR